VFATIDRGRNKHIVTVGFAPHDGQLRLAIGIDRGNDGEVLVIEERSLGPV
jgi:hypothetical protein